MPPDHRAKISTVNLEEVVEILEDSKIFVAAMYPTMVWNLGRHLFSQFTMPYSRLSINFELQTGIFATRESKEEFMTGHYGRGILFIAISLIKHR